MTDMGSIFGIIGVACGLYIFYAVFRMKTEGIINETILVPKNTDMKKCKDKAAYIREAVPKMIVLGVVVLIYGCVDLYNSYVQPIGNGIFWTVLILLLVAIVWFGLSVSKMNKKYF